LRFPTHIVARRQSSGIWNSINFGGLAEYNGYGPANPSVGHAHGHHHRYSYHGNFKFGLGYHHRSSSFAIGYGHYFAG